MSNLEREHCKTITKNHYSVFLKKRNVVGLAFGYKITKNIPTNKPCLKVFVSLKESESILNDSDLIPKTYNGMLTDVIETGPLFYNILIDKKLPMEFGYSIGAANFKGVGTSACLVKDKCDNYYILSNNHVLSNSNKLPIGTPILYPGVRDGGSYPEDLIGILAKIIPTIPTPGYGKKFFNYVDCALARVINPSLVTKQIALIGSINGVVDAEINLNVKKVGRSSGLTTGKITELDGLVKLQAPDKEDILYHNQIITTSMSENGDSGSLVLDENNNAVGLLFGSSESISMVNPIKSVLTALDVSIVTS